MRLVALVLTLGSLSAGCAMEAGEPSSTEEPQRQQEIVAVSGSARPITPEPGPTPTATAGGGPATVTVTQTNPATGPTPMGGPTFQADNPNPSPWDPHNGSSKGP